MGPAPQLPDRAPCRSRHHYPIDRREQHDLPKAEPLAELERLPAEQEERQVAAGDVDDVDGEQDRFPAAARAVKRKLDEQDHAGEQQERMRERRQHHAGEQDLADQERARSELAHQQHRVTHMDQPGLHPTLELVSSSVFRCLGKSIFLNINGMLPSTAVFRRPLASRKIVAMVLLRLRLRTNGHCN